MRSSTLAITAVLLTVAVRGVSAEERRAFVVESVLRHEEALGGAHDVELLDHFAIVAGKPGNIAVVDIANPAAPRLVWHDHDPDRLFEAETVLIQGRRMFLGTMDFLSLDMTNPVQPVYEGEVRDRPRISRINGMVQTGHTVFAANKDGWIDAFDVSDPHHPRLAAALNVREKFQIDYPHDVDLIDRLLVVADPQKFGAAGLTGKVAVFRVFDGERLLPAEEWQLTGVVDSPELTGANRVKVSGRFVFVTGSQKSARSHFAVIDLADPSHPRQVAALPFSDLRGPNGLTLGGCVAFPAGGQMLEAIDISNPAQPRRLAAQSLKEALPAGADNAHDLVYRDGRLYITGQNDASLVVLKIVDEEIVRLAESKTP